MFVIESTTVVIGFLLGWLVRWLSRGGPLSACACTIAPHLSLRSLTLTRRHLLQRAQVSELQQQNAQLSASAKRAEAEALKSVAALKAVKESRAFSTNQKVALGSMWVDGASRHGPLHVCVVSMLSSFVRSFVCSFLFVCLFVCLFVMSTRARTCLAHACMHTRVLSAPCRTARSVGCATKRLR